MAGRDHGLGVDVCTGRILHLLQPALGFSLGGAANRSMPQPALPLGGPQRFLGRLLCSVSLEARQATNMTRVLAFCSLLPSIIILYYIYRDD